jgi:RNA-directed DNA polymerase
VRTRQTETELAEVSEKAKQARETRGRWSWMEPSVWTERMLTALEVGVKGGKWYSLIDKVSSLRNLESAFLQVKRNKGSAGVDRMTIGMFEAHLEENLKRLTESLKEGSYRPQAIRQVWIEKLGSREKRPLGIPTVRDRVVQTALRNVLEPLFERDFAAQSYGFRPERGAKDALRRVDELLKAGYVHVVDADFQSYYDTIPRQPLLDQVRSKVADSKVLDLLEAYLKQEVVESAKHWTPEEGTPQGGVISALLSNILLTPFDREMRRKGYQLTRYADDWVITCSSAAEARAALAAATRVLEALGVRLNAQKTRIVHVRHGFEYLGYKIKQGRKLQLPPEKVRSKARSGELYAFPREKSIRHFKDQIRRRTRRRAPLTTEELIQEINPIVRGWGLHYKEAHVRRLFHQLDGWIVRRLWSHRFKRWRCQGWKALPTAKAYGELGLVNLVSLIPSLAPQRRASL